MSVPKGKRKESELVVITEADKLVTYTIRICTNEKKFPKRYRWCLTKNIVEAAVCMKEYISRANSVHINDRESYILRRTYQQRAIAELAAMHASMDVAFRVFSGLRSIMNDAKEINIVFWTQQLATVKKLLLAWKKKDTERYKAL
jgi:hypothetical protein